ncbi:MAG: hypothetical protein JO193_07555 [Candidatus Eremiobacteraeota bacterium]|nr:hypothetical protein [Candidatus Eremiobacteraeota bacterium]MBV9972894.1 hypothetical protein [Candidatus Eremiobacteraeota bacterium]
MDSVIGIASDRERRLYILERFSMLAIYDPQHERFTQYRIWPFLNATGIRTASDGSVYAIGYGEHPVARIGP